MLNFGLNSASVLAQVNFGTNSASILGIFLAVAGAALYFLRTVRPELSRDQDIFFAAVGLLCGFILIFQGWRLDPILQFGQLLLVGTTVFFAVESIRLRSIATQQAKRNTPIVDDERPVSKNYSYNRRKYEAEVEDDYAPLPYEDEEEEERPVRARIRPSREDRSSRDNYYEEQPPRKERRNTTDRQEPTDKPRRRPTNRPTTRTSESYEQEDWGSASRQVDDWESSSSEVRRPSRRGNNNPRPEVDEDVQPRPRKRRPPADTSSSRREPQDDEAIPTDYVPYKPIDQSDEDSENSTNFDDI
ncbi:Ycf66-like protein [Trichormus variabilis ATCC 29413]|uniref:Ycf66-like protein n=2 Tax=Anabaena variabilis TaxID=264691 RepID=Q3MFU3_TRIV2|nr:MULTISPECIES: Ycf66 family protein [Nostocaceae]ABA20143.1 Ycf66-like protein [Trichormus variabilis ATCC 29413]MBC1214645.1 Ycf66 family protein [Trichormus variabilis ARAD]MBC1255839.1 Ycf66 family protein [Trichormus variabilis V5]MBC1266753.1 Ycf66 family protein [Trichormus variabilis FSR]MBC1303405.1 Ycf66 family protein [Trichormus variabilis N2B]